MTFSVRYDSHVEAMCFLPSNPIGPLTGFCTVAGIVHIAWQGSVPWVATPLGTEPVRPHDYVLRDEFDNLWVMPHAQFDCLYDEQTNDL